MNWSSIVHQAVEEETKKMAQNIVARRWWRGLVVVGLVPLFFPPTIFLHGDWNLYNDMYQTYRIVLFSLWVGLPVSLAAVFVTSWWRLGMIVPSCVLLFFNLLVFVFNCWVAVIHSC